MRSGVEPMCKGAVMREFVAWYREVYGDDQLRKLADSAPPEYAAMFDPDEALVHFLPASWYPMSVVRVAFDALAANHNEGELRRMLRDSSRFVVKRSVSTVYRFLLTNVVTPELYARAIPRLWRQLHTTGDRRIDVIGPGRVESVVSNWPGHHPILCTLTIETMCAVFETMGCVDLAWNRTTCVSEGGRMCSTTVSWR